MFNKNFQDTLMVLLVQHLQGQLKNIIYFLFCILTVLTVNITFCTIKGFTRVLLNLALIFLISLRDIKSTAEFRIFL